jgi:hypothetical protein
MMMMMMITILIILIIFHHLDALHGPLGSATVIHRSKPLDGGRGSGLPGAPPHRHGGRAQKIMMMMITTTVIISITTLILLASTDSLEVRSWSAGQPASQPFGMAVPWWSKGLASLRHHHTATGAVHRG